MKSMRVDRTYRVFEIRSAPHFSHNLTEAQDQLGGTGGRVIFWIQEIVS